MSRNHLGSDHSPVEFREDGVQKPPQKLEIYNNGQRKRRRVEVAYCAEMKDKVVNTMVERCAVWKAVP